VTGPVFNRASARPVLFPRLGEGGRALACALALIGVALPGRGVAQEPVEIDVAVGYTREALEDFGGERNRIRAHMLTQQDRINAILEASGARVRLNILAVDETAGFRQSTFAADRTRFIRGKDGGEALERLRDSTGADIRLLMVSYGGNGSSVHYGGLFRPGGSRAETLKNAYMMIGTNADTLTFAHEMGHVLGCQHARRRPCLGARDGGLPFAYGFRSRDGVGTIMAGSCATRTLVPLFSSPQLTYSYRADGTERETSIRLGSETADCVRAMTNNAPHLAGLNDRRAEPLGERPEQAPQVADLTEEAEAKAVPAAAR